MYDLLVKYDSVWVTVHFRNMSHTHINIDIVNKYVTVYILYKYMSIKKTCVH